jgi:methionyl aminopeptidase
MARSRKRKSNRRSRVSSLEDAPPMIVLKTQEELAIMREANLFIYETLNVLARAAVPGVTTWDLDKIAAEELKRSGMKSPFLGYHGYPCVLCTSVNEVVVHGIPSKKVTLKEGDIIGIDFGAIHKGYVGDSARTVVVGKGTREDARRLIQATAAALEAGIAAAVPGARVSDIGKAVQAVAEEAGMSVVREFVGHGIGRRMHEDPQVPNYYSKEASTRLRPGLVLAIEPMLTLGQPETETLKDGWTAVTKDGTWSAHFEHSVAVTETGPIVLSRPS